MSSTFRDGERVRVRVGDRLPILKFIDPNRWCFATVKRTGELGVLVACDPPFTHFEFVIADPSESSITRLGLLDQIAEAAQEPPKRPKRKR